LLITVWLSPSKVVGSSLTVCTVIVTSQILPSTPVVFATPGRQGVNVSRRRLQTLTQQAIFQAGHGAADRNRSINDSTNLGVLRWLIHVPELEAKARDVDRSIAGAIAISANLVGGFSNRTLWPLVDAQAPLQCQRPSDKGLLDRPYGLSDTCVKRLRRWRVGPARNDKWEVYDGAKSKRVDHD
jgi:hypothetical protein